MPGMNTPMRGLSLSPYSLAKYLDPLPIPVLAKLWIKYRIRLLAHGS
jgi:hypothetical protein